MSYSFVKVNNDLVLSSEILNSSLKSKIASVTIDGDNIDVITIEDLTLAEEADLQAVIDAHDSASNIYAIQCKIQNAIDFGTRMLVEFAAENVAMGITQAGKTKAVIDYLAALREEIYTGSLYSAIETIDALIAATVPADLSPFVTEARLTTYKGKIQAYLNIA